MNKTALSSVIATVLLVSLTLALAIIVFSWSTNFVKNLGPPVNCENVNFKADFSSFGNTYFLNVENIGTAQLEGFLIKQTGLGEVAEIEDIELIVSPGKTESIQLKNIEQQHVGREFLIIPEVSIETSKGALIKTCSNKFGEKITL